MDHRSIFASGMLERENKNEKKGKQEQEDIPQQNEYAEFMELSRTVSHETLSDHGFTDLHLTCMFFPDNKFPAD